ncbi:hypothetical protein [Alcaligenes faecalis]|nr:hypothetical protein [Alcaligenes faecalis]MDV2116935.1 hypothetical protein [Alcaligenes faecalis]
MHSTRSLGGTCDSRTVLEWVLSLSLSLSLRDRATLVQQILGETFV